MNSKTGGLERSPIVKVTGHRNEKSLDDYDEENEYEQRQLSHTILSATAQTSMASELEHTAPLRFIVAPTAPPVLNPSSLDARGNNFNQASFVVRCQVTSLGRMISVSLL